MLRGQNDAVGLRSGIHELGDAQQLRFGGFEPLKAERRSRQGEPGSACKK